MRHLSNRRIASPALLALALGATAASCNLVIGLDAFIDCPEDPKCPALTTGTGGATTTTTTPSNTGGSIPAPACDDTVKNGTETDIDCGGSCPADCADGLGCDNGGDCVSKLCTGGTCVAASCTDGVSNGDETDKDCGGTCPPCAFAQACVVDGDCEGGLCTGGKCAATCTDGLKNGEESDEDCGGATCPKCLIDKQCATGPDCETGVCQAAKCVSNYVWQKQFGDSSSQSAYALTSDALGNAFLFSSISGSTDFGGGPLTTSGATAAAKFDPTGLHLWSKLVPASATSVATDKSGNLLLGGTAANGANLGGGPLSGLGPHNMYVAKLGTGGNHLFSKMFVGARNSVIAATKLSTGFVLTGGMFPSAIDFGCGSLQPISVGDIPVAKFDAQNNCVWSKRFGSASTDGNNATAIAVDDMDNVVIAGTFLETIDFGCGPNTSAPGVLGDLFVTKLDSSGECIWTRTFTDPVNGADGDHPLKGISVDSDGNISFAGYFSGSLTFEATALTGQGLHDIFAGQLDASGAIKWAKSFGAAGAYNTVEAFTARGDGRMAFGGALGAGTDFGGGPLPVGGAFVAELDANGHHLWSRDFLSVQVSSVNALAYGGANNLLAAGGFTGQIDFGGPTTLTTMGSFDAFLTKFLVP